MTPDELGQRIGVIIVQLVDLLAEIDGVTRDTVLDELLAAWWAERVAGPDPG